MAQLQIKHLHIDPKKPNAGPRWKPVTLNVEVEEGDYRIIISKVGSRLLWIVKYEMVEDEAFSENGNPPPPSEVKSKRWNRMYRCWFNLNFTRNSQNPTASPISHEENVTYPEIFPEVITKEPPPEGQTWPKDPYYRLYKNYKYPDPTPPENLNKCELEYVGNPNAFIRKTGEINIIDLEQKIRQPGETPPPDPSKGEQESAEETAKRLKNFLKLHDIKGDLKAEYKILTVKEKEQQPQGGGQPTIACNIEGTQIKNIQLRSLGLTEETKDEEKIIAMPIITH